MKLHNPTRNPDYVLELNNSAWMAFWFEEKIQTNNLGFTYRFNIETMQFEVNGNWWKYKIYNGAEHKIKDAYIKWLLEKAIYGTT